MRVSAVGCSVDATAACVASRDVAAAAAAVLVAPAAVKTTHPTLAETKTAVLSSVHPAVAAAAVAAVAAAVAAVAVCVRVALPRPAASAVRLRRPCESSRCAMWVPAPRAAAAAGTAPRSVHTDRQTQTNGQMKRQTRTHKHTQMKTTRRLVCCA